MKVLRIIIFIILALVAIGIILGLIGPKDYDVNYSAHIDAPKEVVYPYLASLEKGDKWGPWKETDPEMQVSFSGEQGTVGSKSSWDGPNAGKGEQEIVALQKNAAVDTKIKFIMPWGESESSGYLRIEDEDQGSKVTWGFKGDNDFPSRAMGVFMNMEKQVQPMFKKGLENLDALIQKDLRKKYNGYTVNLIDFPGRQFLAKRERISMDKTQSFFETNLPALATEVGKAGVERDGMPCGIYYEWDGQNQSTDMAAAIGVKQVVDSKYGEIISLPPGKCLMIDYYGPYDQLVKAYEAMDKFMADFGLEPGLPVFEEYVTDPGAEPDPGKWLTRIYFPLKT